MPVHANWHHIHLESGPYTLEGELATLPGFDPGRALTRPSGEFLLLRDIRLSVRARPESGVAVGDHALVNRYAVERIRADLMLGFFFPGAAVDPIGDGGRPGLTPAASARPPGRRRAAQRAAPGAAPDGGPACDGRGAPCRPGRDRPEPRAAAARCPDRG